MPLLYSNRTSTRDACACRRTFARASCPARSATTSSSAGSGRGSPSTVRVAPPGRSGPIRSTTCRSAAGSEAARRAGGVAAAIIGDNLGYWAARKGGRPLLERHRLTRSYAEKYLPRGERFFARHGAKAVFFGRFVAVLRVTAAWIAGISHMQWWRFLLWNALGGIVWATGVSLISYYLGDAAAKAFSRYGLYAAGGAILLSAIGFLIVRRLEKRVLDEE